jgi:uncharacterized protein (DUF736 family)
VPLSSNSDRAPDFTIQHDGREVGGRRAGRRRRGRGGQGPWSACLVAAAGL